MKLAMDFGTTPFGELYQGLKGRCDQLRWFV